MCQLSDLIFASWHHIWIVLGPISKAKLAVALMYLPKPFHALKPIPWLANDGSCGPRGCEDAGTAGPVNYNSFMCGLGHDVYVNIDQYVHS